MEQVRIVPAGDAALVLELPQRIDPAINARAAAVAAELRRRWSTILRDVVVGYCTVTLYFDPLRVDAPWLEGEMSAALERVGDVPEGTGPTVEVPVCYDADLAPDLADVAAFGRCSPAEVVELHTSRTYRVYMVGFIPGFAYLAEVDPRIAAPRRPAPRLSVPPGAVAIAGPQTGIYPAAAPGGWNLIGRTRLEPYDPTRDAACLFRPGDTVRFVRVSRDEFERTA